MKRTIKLLSLLLALVMAFSCLGTQAFAATSENVRQYGAEGGFLAIGDSNFRGYGSEDYYTGRTDTFAYRVVKGSAPYLVAQAVGCNITEMMGKSASNYWPLCYPGQTLGSTMDIYGIEDNFTDVEFDYQNYIDMMKYFGYEGSSVGARGESFTGSAVEGSVIDLTRSASLIAVQLGMCDVFYRALRISSVGGSFAGGFDVDLSDPASIAEFVAKFLGTMYEGYDYWLNNFPTFIQTLKALNPEADIVIVGAYNMVEEVELSDESFLPIGSAVAAITASMNSYMQQWAEEYGCLYADVTNTETAAGQYDWSFMGEFLAKADIATHPTPEGHAYMARQILSVLSEKQGAITDISVDLGRFESVSYVLLDGKLVSDYTMDADTFTLTVPYTGKDASNLTVAVLGEDGKLAIMTYQLSYDNGYTAYRIYGTNDAAKTASKAVNSFVNIGKTIAGKLSGLFKK